MSGVIVNEFAPVISQERVVVSPSFMRLGCAWKDFISSVDAGNWPTCDEGLAEVERLSEEEDNNPAEHEPKKTAMASNVSKDTGIESALVRVVIILSATVPHTVNNVL
jgi:hypothetical protein